jgi:hypothetical protein
MLYGYTKDTIGRTDFIILQERNIWEQDELMFLGLVTNAKKFQMEIRRLN